MVKGKNDDIPLCLKYIIYIYITFNCDFSKGHSSFFLNYTYLRVTGYLFFFCLDPRLQNNGMTPTLTDGTVILKLKKK